MKKVDERENGGGVKELERGKSSGKLNWGLEKVGN